MVWNSGLVFWIRAETLDMRNWLGRINLGRIQNSESRIQKNLVDRIQVACSGSTGVLAYDLERELTASATVDSTCCRNLKF
jgi:hypothetical protein